MAKSRDKREEYFNKKATDYRQLQMHEPIYVQLNLIRQHGRRQTSLGHPQKTTRRATRSNYQPEYASPGIVATYGQIVEQHLMTMNQTRCPTENQGVHVDLVVRAMLPEDYDTTNWDNHHIKLCYYFVIYLLLLCYYLVINIPVYIDLCIYVYTMYITSTMG